MLSYMYYCNLSFILFWIQNVSCVTVFVFGSGFYTKFKMIPNVKAKIKINFSFKAFESTLMVLCRYQYQFKFATCEFCLKIKN